MPLFLFSVLFGLSMDYQVFLLSRIKERYDADRRHDDAKRSLYGVASTARIITGAALIIVVVFAGFAAGELVMFQQMGFGVAVALLIDATLIRSVVAAGGDAPARPLELVPAALARVAAARRGRAEPSRGRARDEGRDGVGLPAIERKGWRWPVRSSTWSFPAEDADRAQRFWSGLFGWSFQDSGMPDMDYRMAQTGEQSGAAVYPSERAVGSCELLLRDRRHRSVAVGRAGARRRGGRQDARAGSRLVRSLQGQRGERLPPLAARSGCGVASEVPCRVAPTGRDVVSDATGEGVHGGGAKMAGGMIGRAIAGVGAFCGLLGISLEAGAGFRYADDGTMLAFLIVCMALTSYVPADLPNRRLDRIAALAGAAAFGFFLVFPSTAAFDSLGYLDAGAGSASAPFSSRSARCTRGRRRDTDRRLRCRHGIPRNCSACSGSSSP